MGIISLNQQLKRVNIDKLSLDNEIVFNFFDKLPQEERDEKFNKALYIGVLALMEDRLSAFLSKTSNELGTELESLKIIFDMKSELFYKSAVKGLVAEDDIIEFLNQYFKDKKIKDKALGTGRLAGSISKNKTGDILCTINDDESMKIAVEVKFDKSIKLGDIADNNVFTKKYDTAWSQLIETQANRGTAISIIVFDIALVDKSVMDKFENVGFIPQIGFIAIVDSQKGDFRNLIIAYMLARDIIINSRPEKDYDINMFSILVMKIIKNLNEIKTIEKLVNNNIKNNQEILKQINKSMLLMEFNERYFSKFLKDGNLTSKDLLDFYYGEEIKEKYKILESDIITTEL